MNIQPHCSDTEEYPIWYINQINFNAVINHFVGGVPGHNKGIDDDVSGLTFLVRKTGELILNEEKIAHNSIQEIQDVEGGDYVNEIDSQSHRLNMREYSYNSFLFLIHTIFENRVNELCEIISRFTKGEEFNSMKSKPKNISLLEFRIEDYILPRFDGNPLITNPIKERKEIRANFNKVRNFLYHNNGLVSKKSDLCKWIDNRSDVKCIYYNDDFVKIRIVHSSFIIAYIEEFRLFFKEIKYKVQDLESMNEIS